MQLSHVCQPTIPRYRRHFPCSGSDERAVIPQAFTLIELLVVIGVITLIAAMIFPTIKAVNRVKFLARARGELAQVESSIDSYKASLGHYPPDNRNPNTQELVPGLNPLYYELAGTILTNNMFITKDNSSQPLSPTMVSAFFGVGVSGFVNTDRGNSDDSRTALQLLTGFKHTQIAETTMTNGELKTSVTARILVCTVPGPDPNNPPLNFGSPPLNPWRYNSSSPTNNPSTYDLWTDIQVGGKVLRVSNWSSQPVVLQ